MSPDVPPWRAATNYFGALFVLEELAVPLFAPPGVVAPPWLALGAAVLVSGVLGVVAEELGALLLELPVLLFGSSPVPPVPWFWLQAVSAKAAQRITMAFFIFG